MSKKHYNVFSHHENWSSIKTCESKHGSWLEGEVGTPSGFVLVYSQGDDFPNSSYRLIWKEKYYLMSEPVERTSRGLAIIAGKFVKQVIEGQVKNS